ncbi:alanine racemase [candidate division WOR-3 bacterium]|nr:alanine racemase [candidate division WOR-3 bacterium]
MAKITLNSSKLRSNYKYLDKIFKKHEIKWAVVTKLLCGNREYLEEVLKLNVDQVCDSRLSSLKMVKSIDPGVETIYIKPPPQKSIPSVVKYADISLNTELKTVGLLSKEAQCQNKIHKIIIMIEMGELREGVMRDRLMDFYLKIFELPNIEVVGIGTNLACLNGVLPNHDKLIQLSLYKQLIEAKFGKRIPLVSGGASVTIPLIFQNLLPRGINHFRVGESLFLGTDVYNGAPLKDLHPDVFKLYCEIIELKNKPSIPIGDMGTNIEGESQRHDINEANKNSHRAIIDIGILDVDKNHVFPADDSYSIIGASSDMFVIDLGDNPKNYKTGDFLEFKLDYLGVLRIMNSKFIDKRFEIENK